MTRLRTNFCCFLTHSLPSLILSPPVRLRCTKKQNQMKMVGWRLGAKIGQLSHDRYGIIFLCSEGLTFSAGQGYRLSYHADIWRHIPFYTSRAATQGFCGRGELESTATRHPGLSMLNPNSPYQHFSIARTSQHHQRSSPMYHEPPTSYRDLTNKTWCVGGRPPASPNRLSAADIDSSPKTLLVRYTSR